MAKRAIRRRDEKVAWIVGLSALGLLVVGGVAFAASKAGAAAAPLPPVPAPGVGPTAPGAAPAPAGPAASSQAAINAAAAAAGPPPPNPTDVVMDPGAIAVAGKAFTALAPGLGFTLQAGTSLDANPASADQNFISVVTAFQQKTSASTTPNLRVDGVMDWLTWASGVLDAGLTIPGFIGSTPTVTDPAILKMANAAALVLLHKAQSTSMGIKPGFNATQIISAAESWLVAQGASGIPAGGEVNYFILAFLIAQAYETP